LLEAAETRLAAEQGLPALIDDLVAQHDEVRDRNAEVRRVLDAIDHDHDEVRVERSNLNGGLQEAAADPGPAVLSRLHDTVKKLDWILQGHFLDEEDNLFEPAAGWFDIATLASLTASMAAIEAANR